MLVLEGVHVYYGNIQALFDLSLKVEEGEIVTLIGSNGAGKTTTLRTISGLLSPKQGSVSFVGEPIQGRPAEQIVARGIAHAPEGRRIFTGLSVRENLEMGAYLVRDVAAKKDRLERVFTLFPRLEERIDQSGGTLSGGEQQMLAMARALSTDPALLILDELSMGLAPLIVRDIYERVAEIAADGVSILVVEQFAHDVLDVADTAAIMLNGSIRRIGPPAEIAEDLETAYLSGTTT